MQHSLVHDPRVMIRQLYVHHTLNSYYVRAEVGVGADLLSHEATFSTEMFRKAQIAQHSTASDAGAFARRIQARSLVLTHFSNRYSFEGSRPVVRVLLAPWMPLYLQAAAVHPAPALLLLVARPGRICGPLVVVGLHTNKYKGRACK